jgi:O-acetyl-ADP-ribose deacetylase (regulator of RNase III)
MITFKKEDILKVRVDAIVNSVNLTGVMGKGVALAIKEAFPENYEVYKKACNEKNIDIGEIFVTETGQLFPKYIVNFPTKKHWRYPSRYEWIEAGLKSLVNWIRNSDLGSIAIPPLGSGNGKLDWDKVKPMIVKYLKEFENSLEIIIIEPSVKFAQTDNVKTIRSDPKLTPARAMILYVMNKYRILGFEINLLVVQKIAYFLQRLGEPLRLKFEKGYYGPFAYNIIPVLRTLRYHYINYKTLDSAKPSTVIRLDTTKMNEVEKYIENNLSDDQKERLQKTLEIIRDFETPFGLELLGTVDYIFTQKKEPVESSTVMSELKEWTNRKDKLYKLYHIDVAKNRLLHYFKYN